MSDKTIGVGIGEDLCLECQEWFVQITIWETVELLEWLSLECSTCLRNRMFVLQGVSKDGRPVGLLHIIQSFARTKDMYNIVGIPNHRHLFSI